jgi:amidase
VRSPKAELARIAATDAAIEAWAHLDPLRVRAEAVVCDARKGVTSGPLNGIGIASRTSFRRSTSRCSSARRSYAGHRPSEDAACVARLKHAGGFVFGKAVTTAFAFLDPSKTGILGTRSTRPAVVGGPAAAVAADMSPARSARRPTAR